MFSKKNVGIYIYERHLNLQVFLSLTYLMSASCLVSVTIPTLTTSTERLRLASIKKKPRQIIEGLKRRETRIDPQDDGEDDDDPREEYRHGGKPRVVVDDLKFVRERSARELVKREARVLVEKSEYTCPLW